METAVCKQPLRAYLTMARHIDEPETQRRLDFYLDLDAELMRQKHEHPILH